MYSYSGEFWLVRAANAPAFCETGKPDPDMRVFFWRFMPWKRVARPLRMPVFLCACWLFDIDSRYELFTHTLSSFRKMELSAFFQHLPMIYGFTIKINDSFTKVAHLVRISCELCPDFTRNPSVFVASFVRFKIEFCPHLMRQLSAGEQNTFRFSCGSTPKRQNEFI